MEKHTVYAIVNRRTHKSYFGRTKDFKMRKRSHLNSLISNIHHDKVMQNDYNNGDRFRFLKLKECTTKYSASIVEHALISDYECYNNVGALISQWDFILIFKLKVVNITTLTKISKKYEKKTKRWQAYRKRAEKNN